MLKISKLIAPLFIALLPLSAPAQELPPPSISVSGEGRVNAAPDIGFVTLGVRRQAATAAGAMAAANQAAADVLEEVRARGIEDRDVQTTNVGLNPIWQHSQNDQPKVTGYEAVNDLAIRIRDLDALGPLLDALVKEGANNVQSVSFGIDDMTALRREARLAAIRDAREKAETLAEGAGVELWKLRMISEGSMGGGPRPMMRQMSMAMDEAEAAVPIATGEMEIVVRIDAVWDIVEE